MLRVGCMVLHCNSYQQNAETSHAFLLRPVLTSTLREGSIVLLCVQLVHETIKDHSTPRPRRQRRFTTLRVSHGIVTVVPYRNPMEFVTLDHPYFILVEIDRRSLVIPRLLCTTCPPRLRIQRPTKQHTHLRCPHRQRWPISNVSYYSVYPQNTLNELALLCLCASQTLVIRTTLVRLYAPCVRLLPTPLFTAIVVA